MKAIRSALISVFSKEGIEDIVRLLEKHQVKIYSTGGTQKFIESLGAEVTAVEAVTGYPSILDGRVKTLHPKVFGGLLAMRNEKHLAQLHEYDIPEIDLVIVDLYPFEQTLANTKDEGEIIEKIDIGGIALIRGAAKNFNDVVVVPSKEEYSLIKDLFIEQGAQTNLEQRKEFARRAFRVSSHYDTAIYQYFNRDSNDPTFKVSSLKYNPLRYGENPHQKAHFHGDLSLEFEQLNGKALSYNNMVDVDAAMAIMAEFKDADPSFAVLKHTNTCGLATRPSVLEAWDAALAGDPVSAFGGILITNATLDLQTAEKIQDLFYEVLLAPDFSEEALALLSKKKKRTILKYKSLDVASKSFRRLLHGVIEQDTDLKQLSKDELKVVTNTEPSVSEIEDLLFANNCVKHLKSNAIALVKNQQLIGMGCGQTSRIDALRHAIEKAQRLGFELKGAVMASDAFFPFPDCVEMADKAGITAVIQPGGSIKDQLSIDYCNDNGVSMVFTGFRHFRH